MCPDSIEGVALPDMSDRRTSSMMSVMRLPPMVRVEERRSSIVMVFPVAESV